MCLTTIFSLNYSLHSLSFLTVGWVYEKPIRLKIGDPNNVEQQLMASLQVMLPNECFELFY